LVLAGLPVTDQCRLFWRVALLASRRATRQVPQHWPCGPTGWSPYHDRIGSHPTRPPSATRSRIALIKWPKPN